MAREADILNIAPQIYTVPVGVTVAVFVNPVAGQASVQIQNLTAGATLFLMGSAGSTLQNTSGGTLTVAGATLAALFATFAYACPVSPTMVTLEGPASFYLAATGATATVHILRRVTSGF